MPIDNYSSHYYSRVLMEGLGTEAIVQVCLWDDFTL